MMVRLCLKQHYHLNSNLYFMKQLAGIVTESSHNPHLDREGLT